MKTFRFMPRFFLGLIENGTIDVPLEVVDILLEGRREKLTYHASTKVIIIKAILTQLANPGGDGISFFFTALTTALNWGLVKADDSFKTLCRKTLYHGPLGSVIQKLFDKILKGVTETFTLSGRWPYFSDPLVN